MDDIEKNKNILFEFKNLCCSVKIKKEQKIILENVSGRLKSGQVLAILGHSGSGKTSLLTMLSQRITAIYKTTGRITINDQKITNKRMKNMSGYVMQENLLLAFQNVEETIDFSAKLRCPVEFTEKDCIDKSNTIINELGLKNCKKSKIGNEIIRGISGGEKKRVSIAVEMVRDLSILFLDEPTTGLDSFTAYTVIQKLKNLALKRKIMVIFTIHQPRSNIFELFDKIMLISMGKSVYFGGAKEAIKYFASMGYDCPLGFNFTDYLLDISTPDYRTQKGETESLERIKMLHEKAGSETKSISMGKSDDKNTNAESNNENLEKYIKRKNNFVTELPIVMKRQLKEYLRNYIILTAEVFQQVVVALMIGGFFFSLGSDFDAVPDIQGALFYLILNQTATPLFQTTTLFFLTKPIVCREYDAGFYSTVTFYISKVAELFLLQPLYVLIYLAIVYPMVGFRAGFNHFMILYGILLLCRLCSLALGIFICSSAPKLQLTQIITPIYLYLLILSGGLYIKIDHINVILRQFQYINFIRYSYQMALHNEFSGRSFPCEFAGMCPVSGETIIEKSDLQMSSYALPVGVSLVIMIFLLVSGAILFKLWMPRYKRLKEANMDV